MAIRKKKRQVLVVTGTRADYGILQPVLRAIDKHPKLQLKVLITGMHLLSKFGRTADEVETDGWPIAGRVRLQGIRDNVFANSRAMGYAIAHITKIFQRTGTEIVVVLGDRMEMFAAAAAATASQRTLAHIHGGDAAVGVQDDAYRHAISKLAHIHFTASTGATRRLVRLGEDSFRIYQTGSPALDNLRKKIRRKISLLNTWVGFDVRDDYLIILYHPAGGTAAEEAARMRQILRGCERNDLKIMMLYPNCDPGHSGILRTVQSYNRQKAAPLIRHLPREIFLGLLIRARALVGNSSCGLIEAGFLNVDVINVGPRQNGRDRGRNVIDVDYNSQEVSQALDRIVKKRTSHRKICHIYGDGRSAGRISRLLATICLNQALKQKQITY